jgi:flagellar biosynthesis/type III secretory pathway M-ring protein FliF/YscJ
MDSSISGQPKLLNWFSKTSVRTLMVAAIVLAVLAVLHVNQVRNHAPMKELLQGCDLRNREIHRLQFAFGKAGLDDFEIKDGSVFVPEKSHAKYLAAAAEHDAIPRGIQADSDMQVESVNPFLSRVQQESIEHVRRVKQIQEMVVRLPFVDQAWFEMEQLKRRNAFDTSNQSAVVSVRPAPNACLADNRVATIKKMVAGAVADLSEENILVIDLQDGSAIQNVTDELTEKQRRIQQVASNQQRFYVNQIRELLDDLKNLNVDVIVNIQERELAEPDKVVAIPEVVEPTVMDLELPRAGANGMVSLEPSFEAEQVRTGVANPHTTPILPVIHESRIVLDKQLDITIHVPASTVFEKLGEPTVTAENASKEVRSAEIARQTQSKFEQLKASIIERLLPLFPQNKVADGKFASEGHSLAVKFKPLETAALEMPISMTARVQRFITANWPSIAVLGIGLVLLSIVTRRPHSAIVNVDDRIGEESQSTPSTAAANDIAQDDTDAEVRLTQLIEEDPDSAAKIIETWIRDAA